MKRFLILLPLSLLLTSPHAQNVRSRIGFVNQAQLVASMPGGTNYVNLRKKADTDLGKQQQNIQSLMNKANASPTAANRAAVTKAQQAFTTAQKNYNAQLDKAFKPMASKLNTAIAKVAKANGYSVVMDRQKAATSSLVVYANSATDLTAAVLKQLK